jgi:ferric-dicitrate binding protein FerR (iron transport regulator)
VVHVNAKGEKGEERVVSAGRAWRIPVATHKSESGVEPPHSTLDQALAYRRGKLCLQARDILPFRFHFAHQCAEA